MKELERASAKIKKKLDFHQTIAGMRRQTLAAKTELVMAHKKIAKLEKRHSVDEDGWDDKHLMPPPVEVMPPKKKRKVPLVVVPKGGDVPAGTVKGKIGDTAPVDVEEGHKMNKKKKKKRERMGTKAKARLNRSRLQDASVADGTQDDDKDDSVVNEPFVTVGEQVQMASSRGPDPKRVSGPGGSKKQDIVPHPVQAKLNESLKKRKRKGPKQRKAHNRTLLEGGEVRGDPRVLPNDLERGANEKFLPEDIDVGHAAGGDLTRFDANAELRHLDGQGGEGDGTVEEARPSEPSFNVSELSVVPKEKSAESDDGNNDADKTQLDEKEEEDVVISQSILQTKTRQMEKVLASSRAVPVENFDGLPLEDLDDDLAKARSTPVPPEDPETPEDPEVPEDPEDPEVPEDPEIPEDPENPEDPEDPEIPEDPEEPGIPEDPKMIIGVPAKKILAKKRRSAAEEEAASKTVEEEEISGETSFEQTFSVEERAAMSNRSEDDKDKEQAPPTQTQEAFIDSSQKTPYRSWTADEQIRHQKNRKSKSQGADGRKGKKTVPAKKSATQVPTVTEKNVPAIATAELSLASSSSKGVGKRKKHVKRKLVPKSRLGEFFSPMMNRTFGNKIIEVDKQVPVDNLQDLFATMDGERVERRYLCENGPDTDEELKELEAEMMQSSTCFIHVEDPPLETGLVSIFMIPNLHAVLALNDDMGIRRDNKHLRKIFYNPRVVKFCQDVAVTRGALKKLVPVPPDYEDGPDFLSVLHLCSQMPQVVQDGHVPVKQRNETLMSNITKYFGRGIRVENRAAFDARRKQRDLQHQHRCVRKGEDGRFQLQKFDNNKYGLPPKGKKTTVLIQRGGIDLRFMKSNTQRVLQDAQEELGQDIMLVPRRILWAVFASKSHTDHLHSVEVLLDEPLKCAKAAVLYALVVARPENKLTMSTEELKKLVGKIAQDVADDIANKGFKTDPNDDNRKVKDAPKGAGKVLKERLRMTTWLGMRSQRTYKTNFYPDLNVWAQSLSSLRSGELMEDEVLDKYAFLLCQWNGAHAFSEDQSSYEEPYWLPMKKAEKVFKSFEKYRRLEDEEEKASALKESAKAFHETFRTAPATEWLLPVMMKRKASQCVDNVPKKVVVVVSVELLGFCGAENTQAYEETARDSGSESVPEMTITVLETVKTKQAKGLSRGEIASIATYMKAIVTYFTNKMTSPVMVTTDVDTEPKMKPVEVAEPKDYKLLAAFFLRNLLLGVRGPEDVLDFAREVKSEDHLRVLIYEHILRQEPRTLGVKEVEKFLVNGKFNPALGVVANASSYRRVDSEYTLPALNEPFPGRGVDASALQADREISIDDDWFYRMAHTKEMPKC